jgi:hypothetical protein
VFHVSKVAVKNEEVVFGLYMGKVKINLQIFWYIGIVNNYSPTLFRVGLLCVFLWVRLSFSGGGSGSRVCGFSGRLSLSILFFLFILLGKLLLQDGIVFFFYLDEMILIF